MYTRQCSVDSSRKNHVLETILALLIYLSIPPVFMWEFRNDVLFVIVFIALSLIWSKGKVSVINLKFVLLFIIIYLYFAIWDNSTLYGILGKPLLPCILICGIERNNAILNKFIKIYSALLIPSLIVYFIVVLIGVDIPHIEIYPLNDIKSYHYWQYPFLLTTNEPLSISYFRFMSWFDEPGVVGTISGIILLITGLNFKRWEIFPLLISGIMSFSLAFFIILFANIFFSSSIKTKVIFLLSLIIIYVALSDNDIIDRLIFSRLNIENGQLAGMNRTTDSMDLFMADFIHSKKVFFGYGNNYATIINAGGASYKDLIINYGICGFGIFFLISMAFGISRLRLSKEFCIFIFSWLSIIFQRPFINSLLYFFLLYSPIFYFSTHCNIKPKDKINLNSNENGESSCFLSSSIPPYSRE